jgi:hypothetical protein
MTKKLEDLFELPESAAPETVQQTQSAIADINMAIDKIDGALPAVRGLDASDGEMDELATKASQTFDDLMDLGMQVDSRYAAEIFAVAGTMLGHALTAKTAKLNKKLRMVELQLKKAKFDRDGQGDEPAAMTAEGHVLNRNELLERLITANRDQKIKSE